MTFEEDCTSSMVDFMLQPERTTTEVSKYLKRDTVFQKSLTHHPLNLHHNQPITEWKPSIQGTFCRYPCEPWTEPHFYHFFWDYLTIQRRVLRILEQKWSHNGEMDMEMEMHTFPLPSRIYFKTIGEAFFDSISEEVIPGLFFVVKIWSLERVWYWFKFLLDFHKVRRYLDHLRSSLVEKITKADARMKLEADSSEESDDIQEIMSLMSNQILEAAHEEVVVLMMNQASPEELALAALSKATRKVNFHHLMVANSVDALFEYSVLTALRDTVEFLDIITAAHEITAFLTATIYMILVIKL